MHAYLIACEISGPTAMWTRPDTGDAPASRFTLIRGEWLRCVRLIFLAYECRPTRN